MAEKAEELNEQPEKKASDAVIEIASRIAGNDDGIFTLSSGVRVRIKPVTAALIDQVSSRIKDPDPPMWHNPEKDRDEPNYSDPVYNKKLAEAERERGLAAMDAIMMFGFQLVDGVPEDDEWLEMLQLLGISVDTESKTSREFAYKKFVAVAPDEITLVTERSGISAEELQAAEASFRSDA